MAERHAKRLRRLSTDYDDSDGVDDWRRQQNRGSSSAAPTSTRPRRGVATPPSSARIERSHVGGPEEHRTSIRLTVKAPPSKLREATSGASRRNLIRDNITVNSRDSFDGGEIVVGPRNSRSRKPIVEESSEEEEEEEEEMEEPEEEEDEEEEDVEEDEDEDAEGEEDIDLDDAPPPPLPLTNRARGAPPLPNPRVTVTPARVGDLPSVEAKEMALENDDDDDEELSELESQDEEDDEGGDEDAEGEDDDLDDAEGDEDLDSNDETPRSMSRSNTPDLSKLTRRQRAAYEDYEGGLMALSNEAQKKKHLTAEEHAMRRAEMARRRKNLSEKRNEEEKMDTINRLLKKQAPKRRTRAEVLAAAEAEDEEPEPEKPSPIYVRYVQNREGSMIGVPEEWLGAPVGKVFRGAIRGGDVRSGRPWTGRMVEEVEGTA